MINYNEAKRIVLDFVESNFSEAPILKASFELKDNYVFNIWPEGSKEPPLDPFFKVDKKTGKVGEYSPLFDLEEFKKASPIIEKN